jgi:hypothetical protein
MAEIPRRKRENNVTGVPNGEVDPLGTQLDGLDLEIHA